MQLFQSVDLKNVEEYRDYFQEYSFKKKEIIFSPGKYQNSIFLVLEGKVRLFLNYPGGEEFTLSILEPGDVYSGHTRAFGQALGDVKLAIIPNNVFRDMLVNVPGLVFGLVKVLGDTLKGSIDVIESLVFEQAGARLISLISGWAQKFGESSSEGIVINLNFTREEIASMIGTSRQTLANLLKELSSAGLIEINNKRLLIKDIERLEEYFKQAGHE